MDWRQLADRVHEERLGELFARAAQDARAVATAEIDLQRARLAAKAGEARNGVILLVAALVLSGMASTALVVGLLLIVAQALGPAWATVIVAGGLAVLTGALGYAGAMQLKRLFSGADAKP